MDTLSIELTARDGRGPGVRFVVNGVDLLDQVRAIEEPFALAEGHPNIAGTYAPLPHADFARRRDAFMGAPSIWPSDGSTVLYVCSGCGEEGCWPLLAKITPTDTTVTWRDFSQPYRAEQSAAGHWDHSLLGPFVFDRLSYEAELDQAIAADPPRDTPQP